MPQWHGAHKMLLFMSIDFNYDLIAAWYTIDEVIPYPQYNSGARDKNQPVYAYPTPSTSNPILALEFDIVNEYGFGLKRGYYEIATDENYSCLMFVQSGVIKAKIPVIINELINSYGSDFEWHDDKDEATPNSASKDLTEGMMVASKGTYTKTYTAKEMKKRWKKYKKGMDPSSYFHSAVIMEYDNELGAYKIIWEKYNTRLVGVIKL